MVTASRLWAYPGLCSPPGSSPAPCDSSMRCRWPRWPSTVRCRWRWHWRCASTQSCFQGARQRRRPSCPSCTPPPFGAALRFDELRYGCWSSPGPRGERWISGWRCCRGPRRHPCDSGLCGDKRSGLTTAANREVQICIKSKKKTILYRIVILSLCRDKTGRIMGL